MNDKIIAYLRQYKELYGDDLPLVQTEIEAPAQDNSDQINQISSNDSITLSAFHQQIQNCQQCYLGTCRNKFVFGKGNENAKVLVIGEAPGYDEDQQGLPFVGKAGQLLDKILAAVEFNLNNVYITNIVKCRPPENRDPQLEEIDACRKYLNKQIEILQPKLILALGRVAGQTLLNTKDSLSKLRGRFYSYNDIDLMITYHPSALLRNEAWKRPTWEDMKLFKQKYNELIQDN